MTGCLVHYIDKYPLFQYTPYTFYLIWAMQKHLESAVRWLIIAAFVSPLLVFPEHFIFPFVVPKVWFFRSIAIFLFAAYVLLLYTRKPEYRFRAHMLHYAVGGYFLSFLISTFTGVDWYRSFWENHERMVGLFTLFHYLLFYGVTASMIKTAAEWKNIFRIVLGLGSVVMVIALLQQVNPTLLLNRGSRSASTLGNPIYVGGYGLFLLVIAYLLFIQEKVSSWKWYAAIGGALALGGLLSSGTRGSVLGLFGAIVMLLGVYGITLRHDPRVKKMLISVGVLFTLLVSVLLVFRNTPAVQAIPGIGRVFTVSLESRTVSTRLMAWDVALEGAKEHLVFGWGPGNFFYLFNKYYRPEFLRYGSQETWFDNAHNVVVNTLATQGIVGILAYVSLFIVAVLALIRGYRKQQINVHVLAAGMGFLAAHFIHNLFVFENATSYLYLFFFLAFIVSQTPSSSVVSSKVGALPLSRGIIIAVSVAAIVVVFVTNINPARANMRTLVAMQKMSQGAKDVLSYYEEQVKIIPTPHIDDIRNDMGRAFGNNIARLVQAKRNEDVQKGFVLVDSDMALNQQLHPLDIRIHIQRAEMYRIMGGYTQQPEVFYQESIRIMQEAIIISPKRQQLYYLLAALYIVTDDVDQAVNISQYALDLDPKVAESWWRLAANYKAAGQQEKAQETIATARAEGITFNKKERDLVKEILGVGDEYFTLGN